LLHLLPLLQAGQGAPAAAPDRLPSGWAELQELLGGLEPQPLLPEDEKEQEKQQDEQEEREQEQEEAS
jgi:hypothetical protein